MHCRASLVAIGLVAATMFHGTAVSAQDAPAPEATVQHPADIRSGSCASLGQIATSLASLFVPAGEPQGQAGAAAVEQSVTDIPLLLGDLLATGHAIAVHPSPEQVGTPIACGEIGGALGDDGTLAVALGAMNGAKVSGVAYFAPTPEGDATTVTVLLVDERAGRREDGGVGGGSAPAEGAAPADDTTTTDTTAAADDASGVDGAVAPAPAPAPAPATAGVDGATTISADNADGKNAKPERNKDKATADRDSSGNGGTVTTNGDTNTGNGDRADREGRAHAGEDGGANG